MKRLKLQAGSQDRVSWHMLMVESKIHVQEAVCRCYVVYEKERGDDKMTYNRRRAVEYAHKWAMARNPQYLDFHGLGGDCTNFVSQCLLAGGFPMNGRGGMGWYYHTSYDRGPAWTSVVYLYQFLIRNEGDGPKGKETAMENLDIGDVIQLAFDEDYFSHSLIVVEKRGEGKRLEDVLIACHSKDSDYRQLSTYEGVKQYRYLKLVD
jgi:hypothetical protein